MIEIGSEFWTRQEPIGKEKASNEEYLLSGRTALRFIIDDVCGEREIKKVLLPSYCCESMIRPFADRGISVQFYRVDLGGVDLPFDNDADLILLNEDLSFHTVMARGRIMMEEGIVKEKGYYS